MAPFYLIALVFYLVNVAWSVDLSESGISFMLPVFQATPSFNLDVWQDQIEAQFPLFASIWGSMLLAVLIMLIAYIAGWILAGLFKLIARGLRREETAGPVLDMIGAFLRLCVMGLGALVSANFLGFHTISTAQSLGGQALAAVAILISAWLMSNWFANNIRDFGEKISKRNSRTDRTMFSFFGSMLKYVIMAIAAVFALTQFGFETTSLVAVVGAAGLAIALAMQDTLKGVAAGMMLAFFRPYRIGDFVNVGGAEGIVADITPFITTIMTLDNKKLVVPNDKAWGDVIVNATSHKHRRLDLVYSISYDDNIDHAFDVIRNVVADEPRIFKEPPIWLGVINLGDWSVDMRLRAWCAQTDYVDLQAAMLKKVKEAFDANGITIPYPHQVEYVHAPKSNPKLETIESGDHNDG